MANELLYFVIPVRVKGKIRPAFPKDEAVKMLSAYLHGTVLPALDQDYDRAKYNQVLPTSPHIHKSTPDYACEECIQTAQNMER